MVDPSLLRQAADRGVTIAFADLDGADGLWVPEERTVLVNRGLSGAKLAEVIEHELTHVAIDDQHADLDAGREVLVGRPPARRTGALPVVAAAAAFVAVVGGVAFGLSAAGGPGREQVVGPVPSGLTASEDGAAPEPGTTVVVVRDGQGRVVTRVVPATSAPSRAAATSGSPARSSAPRTTAPRTSAPPPVRPTATRSPAPSATPTVREPSPTTPAPTTPAAPSTPVSTGTAPVEPGDGGAGPGGAGDGGDGPGGDGPGGAGPGGAGPGGAGPGGAGPGGAGPGGAGPGGDGLAGGPPAGGADGLGSGTALGTEPAVPTAGAGSGTATAAPTTSAG